MAKSISIVKAYFIIHCLRQQNNLTVLLTVSLGIPFIYIKIFQYIIYAMCVLGFLVAHVTPANYSDTTELEGLVKA